MEAADFARLMAALGPFEPKPAVAVAVSGGADSLALALLLQDWARAQGGQAVALTVDHRLRTGSGAEARQVGALLGRHGIEHHVLRRPGPKPEANLQAVAREARYALLSEWCVKHGLLHLALAHQQDDQAETLLLRLGRGSGLDGLAAMAPLTETPDLRLLRPLLTVPRARLEATLGARGVAWLDDPSNLDPRHARVRLRRLMPALGAEGLSATRIAAAARHLGQARIALETAVARLLAEAAAPHPAGHIWLDAALLTRAPEAIALRALSRLLQCVGGADYGPRLERLERLAERLGGGLGRGATLGGCRLLPRRGRVLVVREPAAVAPPLKLTPGRPALWDGRFQLAVKRGKVNLTVGALGSDGWAAVRPLIAVDLPAAAGPALPAIRDRGGLLAVPPLDYWRDRGARESVGMCRFSPKNPLSAAGFTVA